MTGYAAGIASGGYIGKSDNARDSTLSYNDLNINGQSLKEFMYAVQDRLAIMRPNLELEKEFEELEACGKHYRELEAKFLEQKKAWNVLKQTD
jgi:hypothetical protein